MWDGWGLNTMIVEKARVASWSNPATSFLRIGDEYDSPNNLFWWVHMKINRRNGKIKRETMKGKDIFSFIHSTITKSGLCICIISFSKLRDFFFFLLSFCMFESSSLYRTWADIYSINHTIVVTLRIIYVCWFIAQTVFV